jgi:glycosyltransferase involved in cell wall biosynthesis
VLTRARAVTVRRVKRPIRALFSFPHRIGAGRICYTAWHQVAGLVEAGVDVTVVPASVHRPLPEAARTYPTLARGRFKVPYRVLGEVRALALHDRIVARRLPRLAGEIDIVHAWPLGALETMRTAARLGIPTVLERPNAHTRFAYEVVQQECDRLGVPLPPDHEHAYNAAILAHEELEYEQADRLLCPSDFTLQTFVDQGVPPEKLLRHIYGFDEKTFHPGASRQPAEGLTVLFVGVAAVRKGLHFALDAWLRSPASRTGRFLIAGEVLPAYGERLKDQLAHPSVSVLGHRDDVPELVRQSDVLVLPSIEEGFGLVCTEAMGSGCVPLVSDACTDVCRHDVNALVHHVGDVDALERHITTVHSDRAVLSRLRAEGLRTAPGVTWTAAGEILRQAYEDTIAAVRRPRSLSAA